MSWRSVEFYVLNYDKVMSWRSVGRLSSFTFWTMIRLCYSGQCGYCRVLRFELWLDYVMVVSRVLRFELWLGYIMAVCRVLRFELWLGYVMAVSVEIVEFFRVELCLGYVMAVSGGDCQISTFWTMIRLCHGGQWGRLSNFYVLNYD